MPPSHSNELNIMITVLIIDYCSQTLKLFGFLIFRCWAYLMKVVPEYIVHTRLDIYCFMPHEYLSFKTASQVVWRPVYHFLKEFYDFFAIKWIDWENRSNWRNLQFSVLALTDNVLLYKRNIAKSHYKLLIPGCFFLLCFCCCCCFVCYLLLFFLYVGRSRYKAIFDIEAWSWLFSTDKLSNK
jgi:hypothetical protein